MPRPLSGAVVAIVGASGGLGAPIAHELSRCGARLILAGPHIDRLTALGIDDAAAIEFDSTRSPSWRRAGCHGNGAVRAARRTRQRRWDRCIRRPDRHRRHSDRGTLPHERDGAAVARQASRAAVGRVARFRRQPQRRRRRTTDGEHGGVLSHQSCADRSGHCAVPRVAPRRYSGVRRATTAHRNRARSATTRRQRSCVADRGSPRTSSQGASSMQSWRDRPNSPPRASPPTQPAPAPERRKRHDHLGEPCHAGRSQRRVGPTRRHVELGRMGTQRRRGRCARRDFEHTRQDGSGLRSGSGCGSR